MNKIELIDDICILKIDNPPNNYLVRPEFVQIKELKNVLREKNCKGILITGAGRHFSAGADLNSIKESVYKNNLEPEIKKGKALIQYLKSLNIPMISAIEGVCFGGGLEIILNTDIKIASEKALFAFPEVNQSLIPGLSGTCMLPKHTRKGKSLEIILGADIFNARQAETFSIVDYVVTPKSTLQFAQNLMLKMTRSRPVSIIQSVVKLVRNEEGLNTNDLLNEETRLFCEAAQNLTKNKKLY